MPHLFAVSLALVFFAVTAQAEPIMLDKPPPALAIAERGELLLQDNQYSYRPWNSQANQGEVHILQYFAGTSSASKIFEPFTDALQQEFPEYGYHVTTVINLDAAMWGTGGFVTSEAKSSKKRYPDSTLVLDEEGVGTTAWDLGKKGAVLLVMDRAGRVIYLSYVPMSEQAITATIGLIRTTINS